MATKTIEYADVSIEDRVDCPLWWHERNLQQTATGSGKKITTRYKIRYQDRLYRIYACCFSNAASHYIIVKGRTLFLH